MKEQIVQQPATTEKQRHFTELPAADTERSTFDRSHGYKTAFQGGRLIPFYVDEILPGDTHNVQATAFVRMATPLKPIFDNVKVDVHWFFVPNRLVWDDWEFFMGERKQPTDDPTTVTIPQSTVNHDLIEATLPNYMGLPITETPVTTTVNALPFRAYEKIFDDWYRPQDFKGEVLLNTDNTNVNYSTFKPRRRYKRRDYFVSALPWPQKGDPVYLPLGTSAPVISDGTAPTFEDQSADNMGRLQQAGGAGQNAEFEVDSAGIPSYAQFTTSGLLADLQTATAATVNDIRTAFQIQKLLERDARGGTRYIEVILNHFNVQSPDMRLQRSEYLGAGSGYININPVANTSATATEVQGELAATATGVIKASFNHSFVEHGYVIGLISTQADLTYQNGVERMWDRKTRYDFYWPTLAHLGEQQIKNKEIWVSGDATDEDTWGFQERYAEYRYKPGRVTATLASNAAAPLDVWHLAQDYDTRPALNEAFLIENPPYERVQAITVGVTFIADMWMKVTSTRPMPVYSVPGLIDHF